MGNGKFNTQVYKQAANNYAKQDRKTLFQQSKIFPDFDPLKIKIRESCASNEHLDPTSIIIACDVTGSMGKIPEDLLKTKLGSIMESLLKIKSISNPQLMFAAVGDTECDIAPLQVTQFESDNRIEAQLKNLYLEGGGGGNKAESYHGIWYFAAYKTKLDSLNIGKKGLLFTMGDELVPAVLKADHIRKFIDKDYKGTDISTSKLVKDVNEKYDIFHLIVQDTSTYQGAEKEVNACWQQYLGERAILVPKFTDIPEKIISTVRTLCELSVQMNKPISRKSEIINTIEAKPVPEEKIAVKLDQLGLFNNKSINVPPDVSKVLNKDNEGIPHLFMCPISQDVMEDPVVAEDGYTYGRKNITDWFQKKATSPMTNQVIGTLLIPNHGLRSEIEQWQKNRASPSQIPTPQQ